VAISRWKVTAGRRVRDDKVGWCISHSRDRDIGLDRLQLAAERR